MVSLQVVLRSMLLEAVGLAQAQLRLTPTKNKQEKNVRWAKDYEL